MSRPFTKLSDSFKILRDNLNTVSYNVGDPANLLTNGDSDVVMAINEIERVFDASAGEILYPTGNALQGETQTRLLLSTAQNSGTDIILKSGLGINLDAVGDINLDAGGANINFLDDSVARFNFTLGATNVLDVTGILDLNISSNLDADIAGNSTLTTTGSQTQEGTSLNLDFSGDITLDADGNDIIFKNGAGNDTVTHTLANDATYKVTVPNNYTLDVDGDIILDADSDANIIFKDAGNTEYTFATDGTISRSGSLQIDVTGDITLDADGNEILFKNGAAGNTVTHTLADNAAYTMATPSDYVLDIVGDMNVDVDGDHIRFKHAGQLRHKYTLGATNLVETTGHLTTTADNRSDSASGTYHIGASGNADITTMGTFQTTSDSQTHNVTGNFEVDASGDITLDADGNDILFKNGAGNKTVTHTLADGGAYTITAPSTYTVDAVGDIVLDADGGDITFKDGASTEYNFKTDGVVSRTGDLTLDISGDIVLDADAGNIDFKDGGTARFSYGLDSINTLDVNGALTRTVGGNYTDSANGTYSITSSGNMSSTTLGTLTTTSGGNQTHNVTGNFTVDASGDINLDAGGDNIRLKDAGSTRQTYTLGDTTTIATTGNLTQTTTGNRTYTVQGNQSDSANGTRDISATAGINIDTLGPMTLTAGGSQNLVSGGNWKATVTGTATIDASTDIILDPDGNDIILKHAGTQWGKLRDSGTNVTLYSGTTKAVSWTGANQRAEGNLHVLGNTDLDGTLNVDGATDLNGHVDLGNATSDNISIIGRVDTNIIPDADDTYDLGSGTFQWKHAFFDGTVTTDDLVADSADIGNFNIIADTISNSNAVSLTTGALTATVTGDALIDASGDITLDADGNDIIFKNGGGADTVTHTLADDATYKIAAPSTYTLDVNGDIVLDANGGDVYLKDNGVQFGRFQNSSNQLDIYSGAIKALDIDASNIRLPNHALWLDSALGTTAQNVAGSINEIHTQLDSAVSKIEQNMSRVVVNETAIAQHNTRMGQLSSLDSTTAGNFFTTTSINNDSIINAINELARRTVLIYDENGTLLN